MAVGEWDHRELCPDGACTGVIGPSGTCKVCGHAAPNWGDERKRGLVAEALAADSEELEDDDDELEDGEEDEVEDEDPISPSAPAALGEAAEWHTRQLCSDGACVGVIGRDGRCKTCGKPGKPGARRVAAARAAEDTALEAAATDLARSASPDAIEALAPAPALDDENDAEDDASAVDEDDATDDDGEDADDADDADAVDAAVGDRALCPDGACVGLIGDDGRCKVCGKEAA